MRLDIFLTENDLAKSRERAKELIIGGGVTVNGNVTVKPSADVNENDEIKVIGETLKYVGRGGLKLEKAIDVFGISVKGKVCVDLGTSTGGFTDCLLKNGAAKVYAVDVGHGQLDESLVKNPSVVNMERTDIRNVKADDLGGRSEFVCCDVSFISLKHILPVICDILSDSGESVVLIKPQFECGRADIGKGGIVRSPKVHERVIKEIIFTAEECGLYADKADYSPVCGGDGNIEYIMHLMHMKRETLYINACTPIDVKKVTCNAFSALKKKKGTKAR